MQFFFYSGCAEIGNVYELPQYKEIKYTLIHISKH